MRLAASINDQTGQIEGVHSVAGGCSPRALERCARSRIAPANRVTRVGGVGSGRFLNHSTNHATFKINWTIRCQIRTRIHPPQRSHDGSGNGSNQFILD